MPGEGPGARYSATATKATSHGMPAVELGHAGIAAKSQQVAPMAPSVANAALAVEIAEGEDFVIMMSGIHYYVPSSELPGGAAAGDPLYIHDTDNSLALAATALTDGALNAAYWKWGLLDSIDTALGIFTVNLTERASF